MPAADWERRYRLSGRWRDLVRWLEALHAEGACARAVEVLEAEHARFPAEAVRWQYLLARCLLDMGQTAAARAVLDELLATQPDHGRALELRFRVARQEQDAATANRILEQLEVLGWDTARLRAAGPAAAPGAPAPQHWDQWVQQARSIDSWLVSMQNVVERTPDVENILRLAEAEG